MEISDILKQIYNEYGIWIVVFIMYLCLVFTIIEAILICWKDRMIIDYIFDWIDRRKKRDKRSEV